MVTVRVDPTVHTLGSRSGLPWVGDGCNQGKPLRHFERLSSNVRQSFSSGGTLD